jgi:hypothetical protein
LDLVEKKKKLTQFNTPPPSCFFLTINPNYHQTIDLIRREKDKYTEILLERLVVCEAEAMNMEIGEECVK